MINPISPYACLPFLVLLLSIAFSPLIFPKFWMKNHNKAIVAAILTIPIIIFLFKGLRHELWSAFEEYFSFIVMIGSLYIITGGILFSGDLRATPIVNTTFLLIGAILANLIGTTGASMLLIRPVLKTNRERVHTQHIPIFFIFLVSNIGGALTPLGDPPLFLGYLRGVPFTWNLSLFPMWLLCVSILLVIFFVWDTFFFCKEDIKDIARDYKEIEPLGISGKRNLIFLLIVADTVFFQVPTPFREIIMMAATGLSLAFTNKSIRVGNDFSWHPVIEIAILFAAIFVTMRPIMLLLEEHGASLGITESWQYFWIVGGLSSFLDNAPTYMTFYSLAESITRSIGSGGFHIIAGVKENLLAAISCGAVFMGANTYIGNGPNFMVKAIAEKQGFKVPHFFEYMLYSGIILLPIFVLITLVFFR